METPDNPLADVWLMSRSRGAAGPPAGMCNCAPILSPGRFLQEGRYTEPAPDLNDAGGHGGHSLGSCLCRGAGGQAGDCCSGGADSLQAGQCRASRAACTARSQTCSHSSFLGAHRHARQTCSHSSFLGAHRHARQTCGMPVSCTTLTQPSSAYTSNCADALRLAVQTCAKLASAL